jgi:hypothetical protein
VNGHFGAVFKSLLPGVSAKLAPPEGGTVLDGLEVKVAFNGVWKETLTDLSGGQRSLLALSLILAMLLFKPAPMYILDEIDAALDLSHTQNIGNMIRTHFAKSQFIVVSLKQGLFNNANVIFRTKFVEVRACAGGGGGGRSGRARSRALAHAAATPAPPPHPASSLSHFPAPRRRASAPRSRAPCPPAPRSSRTRRTRRRPPRQPPASARPSRRRTSRRSERAPSAGARAGRTRTPYLLASLARNMRLRATPHCCCTFPST